MHKPIKYFEKAVTVAANGAWQVFDKLNSINQNPSFTPKGDANCKCHANT